MESNIHKLSSKRRTSKEIYVAIEISRSTYFRRLSIIQNELGNKVGHFWSPSQVKRIVDFVSPN